ncbi:MAG: family 16 glycosylhydrolase [Bacteroidetes bacterium]|jgi:beta-glucanase (GH16 family)|nr:family 16 glycosylhydrolase [Bacteroidota bacterium]
MPVEVVGDAHFELSEFFEVRLTYEGDQSSYSVSIVDDDEMVPVLSNEEGFYTPDKYPSMELVWADEFNGDQLNEDDWTYEIGDGCPDLCGWGNEELQDYTEEEENVRLEDGKLLITAKETESSYTSARIITQDKVELQFGRIDIRAKLPQGQGIWPALWMLGANIDDVSWPATGEIDIMELVGHEPGIVHGTVHFENNGYQTSSEHYMLEDGIFADQYHVFTIVWERNRIRWYVNNQLYKTFKRQNIGNYPFNSPFFFIINVAVGGRWPGNPDETTEFPQQMSVDYIRVFK